MYSPMEWDNRDKKKGPKTQPCSTSPLRLGTRTAFGKGDWKVAANDVGGKPRVLWSDSQMKRGVQGIETYQLHLMLQICQTHEAWGFTFGFSNMEIIVDLESTESSSPI